MSITTAAFSLARGGVLILALVFVACAPASATWTELQVVPFPNPPDGGCPNGTVQCTLGWFLPTVPGSTLALGFGVQGSDMGPVRIVSAYTCNTGGLVCDPTNGNVIDTFVIPNDSTGTPMCADYIGTHSVGCAYVVAGGGGATYLTINITNGDPQGQGNNHWFPSMTEAESSTKAQTFDAAGAAKSSEGTSQSGVSLALSGSSDFIFQAIDAGPSESQITPSSNCSGQAYTGLFDDHYAAAYALNTSCGASPTWTWTGYPDSGVVTAVAFKE